MNSTKEIKKDSSGKVNWGPITLAAFLPAVMELIWQVYNSYIPLYLQAGNASFASSKAAGMIGFGLGPALTGLILVLDNVAGLIISPSVGIWSDGMRTKLGRRLPFILIGLPIAAVAFIFVPLLPNAIPAALNGQTAQLTGLLVPFVISLFVILIAFAVIRTPADALIYDITPSKHRSTANGVAAVIAGLLVAVGSLGGAALFSVYQPLPFWITAGLGLAFALMAWLFIKEPVQPARQAGEEKVSLKKVIEILKNLPKDTSRSLLFLVLSNFLSYIALSQLQAFLTSYGVFTLGMKTSAAASLTTISALTYMAMAIPAGLIARRIRRKNTQIIGLIAYAASALLIFLIPSSTVLTIGLIVAGLGWALTNVNQGPMIVDSAPDDKVLGTFTGIRQISVTLGFIIGPVLGGALVQAFGNNYRWIWLIMVVTLVLAILALVPVNRGEARE